MSGQVLNYIRPKLANYQTQIIDCEKRFTITEASTKSGKTVSHIVWLFEEALKGKEGQCYWWVAPVYTQAKIAFERMQRFTTIPNFFNANKSELTLKLPNGAMIQFKSADNADNLYGEDVYACVFDEFTRAKYAAWVAIRSTLTATKGKCKLIGNYVGDFNWGHLLAEKAKENDTEYAYFKITAFDAVREGILDAKEIEQARKDLHPDDFKMLYMAEGIDEKTMLFTRDGINNKFHNSHVLKDFLKKYITADIATEGSDKLVINVWYGFVIVERLVLDKSSGKLIIDEIVRLKNKHAVPNSNIIYDSDGVGSGLSGFIPNSVGFHNGARALNDENYQNLKTQCYYKYSEKVNAFEVWDSTEPSEEEKRLIKEEMSAIKKKASNDGKLALIPKLEIKENLGRSPDYSDSEILRMYYEIKTQLDKFTY